MQEQEKPEQSPGHDSMPLELDNAPKEMDRRQALGVLAKFTVYTAPAMTTLITSRRAVAASLPGTPGSW